MASNFRIIERDFTREKLEEIIRIFDFSDDLQASLRQNWDILNNEFFRKFLDELIERNLGNGQ